jgi:sugar O-acyltransferase (sialic acid O-acetyltransferase NeuD family)
MSKVIVFGISDMAQLAKYYLDSDSEHEVVAFTVNEEYLKEDEFEGLPVKPFEKIEQSHPPGEYKLFIPMVASGMNKNRERIYVEGISKGYGFISYISSHATVLTDDIGENCFILEDNTIQPYVKIGNNVVLWSGNHIGHHSVIEDHVFFTSHVVLSGHCVVESHCFFGVNSTIRDFTRLAKGTFVAMGACITKNTEPWGVYLAGSAKKHPQPSHRFYK